MQWLYITTIALIISVVSRVFWKYAADKIDPVLGVPVAYSAAFVSAMVVLLYFRPELKITRNALIPLVLAGCFFVIMDVLVMFAFKTGPLSLVYSYFLIGSILLATVLGVVIFKETLTLKIIMGILLGIVSILLLVR